MWVVSHFQRRYGLNTDYWRKKNYRLGPGLLRLKKEKGLMKLDLLYRCTLSSRGCKFRPRIPSWFSHLGFISSTWFHRDSRHMMCPKLPDTEAGWDDCLEKVIYFKLCQFRHNTVAVIHSLRAWKTYGTCVFSFFFKMDLCSVMNGELLWRPFHWYGST